MFAADEMKDRHSDTLIKIAKSRDRLTRDLVTDVNRGNEDEDKIKVVAGKSPEGSIEMFIGSAFYAYLLRYYYCCCSCNY